MAVAQAPVRAAFVMLQVEGLTLAHCGERLIEACHQSAVRRCKVAWRGAGRSCRHPVGVVEFDGAQLLVLEGSLPVGISEGLAGFSALAPPGVPARPERP